MPSHLRLVLFKGLFPVGLPVKILKVLLPSSILATCPAHLNLLELDSLHYAKSLITRIISRGFSVLCTHYQCLLAVPVEMTAMEIVFQFTVFVPSVSPSIDMVHVAPNSFCQKLK